MHNFNAFRTNLGKEINASDAYKLAGSVPIYAGWFSESASIGMFDLMPNTKKLDKQIYNTMRLDYTIVLYYALFAYFVWVSPEKVNQKNWMMYVYGSPIFTGIIAFVIGILIPYGIYSGVKSLN